MDPSCWRFKSRTSSMVSTWRRTAHVRQTHAVLGDWLGVPKLCDFCAKLQSVTTIYTCSNKSGDRFVHAMDTKR